MLQQLHRQTAVWTWSAEASNTYQVQRTDPQPPNANPQRKRKRINSSTRLEGISSSSLVTDTIGSMFSLSAACSIRSRTLASSHSPLDTTMTWPAWGAQHT